MVQNPLIARLRESQMQLETAREHLKFFCINIDIINPEYWKLTKHKNTIARYWPTKAQAKIGSSTRNVRCSSPKHLVRLIMAYLHNDTHHVELF